MRKLLIFSVILPILYIIIGLVLPSEYFSLNVSEIILKSTFWTSSALFFFVFIKEKLYKKTRWLLVAYLMCNWATYSLSLVVFGNMGLILVFVFIISIFFIMGLIEKDPKRDITSLIILIAFGLITTFTLVSESPELLKYCFIMTIPILLYIVLLKIIFRFVNNYRNIVNLLALLCEMYE